MRDLFDKEFQKEMDDFFDYIDYEVLGRAADDEADDMDRDARFAADAEDDEPITELIHKVDGVTVCEPLEDVLKREMEHLEMKAELAVGI